MQTIEEVDVELVLYAKIVPKDISLCCSCWKKCITTIHTTITRKICISYQTNVINFTRGQVFEKNAVFHGYAQFISNPIYFLTLQF